MDHYIDQAERYRQRGAQMRASALTGLSEAEVRVYLQLADQFDRLADRLRQNARCNLRRYRSPFASTGRSSRPALSFRS